MSPGGEAGCKVPGAPTAAPISLSIATQFGAQTEAAWRGQVYNFKRRSTQGFVIKEKAPPYWGLLVVESAY